MDRNQIILKEYLERMTDFIKNCGNNATFACRSIEEFVLTHGKFYEMRPKRHGYQYGRMRECFRNASCAVMDDDRLTYVEGFGITDVLPFPTLHAWCIDAEEKVVDVTWGRPKHSKPLAYFGVPFPSDYIAELMEAREYFGVIDNYEMRYSLMREKFDLKEFWEKYDVTKTGK